MKKQRTKKERSKKYEKKLKLHENVTFDDLMGVAIKHSPVAKKPKKKD